MKRLIAVLLMALLLPAVALAGPPNLDAYTARMEMSGSCDDGNDYTARGLVFKDIEESISPDVVTMTRVGAESPDAVLLMQWGEDREDPNSVPTKAMLYNTHGSFDVTAQMAAFSFCDLLTYGGI